MREIELHYPRGIKVDTREIRCPLPRHIQQVVYTLERPRVQKRMHDIRSSALPNAAQ